IVFSDILVVPEAMGQPYGFREKGGIRMEFAIENPRDIKRFQVENASKRLDYVAKALRLLREELGDEKALLGFCGSPWTLACYAIEGGSVDGFPKALAFAKEQPKAFGALLEKFSRVLVDYLRLQASSGADAIQIFDTWGSLCPDDRHEDWSLRWIREIAGSLDGKVPLILYSKGSAHRLDALANTGVQCLSLDHSLNLVEAKHSLGPDLAVQGNLDPALLDTNPSAVSSAAHDLLDRMSPHPGYIFNLGHGIRPTAKITCVEALAETVSQHLPGS
ncbi:MAG: uroporphyrinogen decarboxylase family protein, partial [Opitutales bacterium]